MILPLVLLLFIFCHIFIQTFWTLTSRGYNYKDFIKTWKSLRSVPIVVIEGIGFFQILLFPLFRLPTIYLPSYPIQIFGLTISLLGVILASWAKKIMGASWGRPAQHDKDKQNKLVVAGPFRFTRNPIYIGLFLLFTGQQIALGSYGILISIIFATIIRNSAIIEEKLLEHYFGKEYIAYKSRVSRFI